MTLPLEERRNTGGKALQGDFPALDPEVGIYTGPGRTGG